MVVEQNLLARHNLSVLNQNYKPLMETNFVRSNKQDLKQSLHAPHVFYIILIYAVGIYDQQYQMPFASSQIYHDQSYLHLELA